MKEIIKDSLSLFLLNLVCALITFFGMAMAPASWDDMTWLSIAIMLVFTGLTYIFMCGDMLSKGQKHCHLDARSQKEHEHSGAPLEVFYRPSYGFICASIAQLPMFLLITIATVTHLLNVEIVPLLLVIRSYYASYNYLYVTLDSALPYLYYAFLALGILLPALAYLGGPTKEKKQQALIAKNKEKLLESQKPGR